MKKIYLAIIITLFISNISKAQVVLFSDNFTTYDSTSGPNYNGWTLTYYGFGSYYTSSPAPAGSSGPSGPNVYKFGRDSATATTPMIMGGDSVHFFMKGNPASGMTLGQSTFYIYESPDGVNWTSLYTFMPPMDTAKVGSFQHFALTPGTMYLKFFYDKDQGNIAFDDFSVTSNTVGISTPSLEQRIRIFPTPTSGKLTINFGTMVDHANLTVINILGKQVMTAELNGTDDLFNINLSNLQDGIYFLKVTADKQSITKRIVIKH